MKVLQINALYGNKSTGTIVRDIHRLMRDASIDSRVACIAAEGTDDGVMALGFGLDNKIHALLTRLNGKQGFYSKTSTKKLLKWIDDEKPDIIHLHNVHSNFLNLPMVFDYARANDVSVVMTLHDCWYFTGKCYHFLDNGCEKWKTKCSDCPKRRQDIPSLLVDSSEKVFDCKGRMYSGTDLYVVGCSKWVTECAKQSPLFDGAHFHQIYNGVDSNIFCKDGDDLADELGTDGKFTVLTMANKWFDGRNEGVRAAVMDEVKKLGGRIIVAGCKDEQMTLYDNDESLIALPYISDRCYLAKLYRTADVFLNLTFVDTLPTVNIESALCATPIITYNSGGSGELVLEGVSGYVVTPLAIDDVISSLRKIKNGAIKREDCSAFALKNFEKTSNYKKYLELYTQICENKKVDRNG